MRIGFMGAQGTGKTTTIDTFLRTPLLGSGPTSVMPSMKRQTNVQRTLKTVFGLEINNTAEFETQFCISSFLSVELVTSEKYIADRTILDNFAYASSCNFTPEQMEYLERTFSKSLDYYDLIFYIPIEFEPPEDGIRIIDKDYRHFIDDKLKEYIEKYKVQVIELRGTVEERVETVRKAYVLNIVKGIA